MTGARFVRHPGGHASPFPAKAWPPVSAGGRKNGTQQSRTGWAGRCPLGSGAGLGRSVGRPMTRGVAVARTVWGGGLLVASRYLPVPRNVVLALGFRHLVQGAVAMRRPDGIVARWGWTADAAHSVSMFGLAAVSRRWRVAALANAVVAAGWARAAKPRPVG